jgi:DNA-binding response OmpR family regulator
VARIVLIDDSKFMRKFIRRSLEEDGHQVEEWEDLLAEDIPALIQAFAPDIIITDYMMPGCNGLVVAQTVHATQPGLPVLVITAQRDPTLEEALRKVEVVEIMHKPLRVGELKEALRLLL